MVFGAFERMVSFRYLRARREEGFVSLIAAFSLLGIMLGVGTLIVVMSVMNGFRAEFLKEILGFQGDISVLSRDAPKALQNFDALAAAIRQVPGVVDATPIIDNQIIIQSERRWTGVAVRGIRIEDLRRNHDVADHIVDGSLDGLDDDSIMLGFQVSLSLGVHVGDTVTLTSPQGTPTPIGILPRRKSYRVAATFEELPIPVIAAVNGFAVGGGWFLALACDLRIAVEGAEFWMPEVDLGQSGPRGPEQWLTAHVGAARAKEIIFTCRHFKAEELYQWGLLNRVVTKAELMPVAMELARSLAAKNHRAIVQAKAQINGFFVE